MIPRTACIVAVGTWGGSRCLVKVRDRNYEPKLKAYHEIRNGVEVLYVKDEGTGWVEGLNEFGIGVVSSALSVQRDENEKRLVKEVGKRGKDGVRILKVLEQKTLDDAVEQACSFKGGISGHTFVSDPEQTKSVESTKKHDCITKTVRMDHVHVRTNHGFSHEDAGYTDGDDYVSSVYRRDRAQKILRGLEGPKDLAPAIYAQKREPGEMNSVIRDTDNMRTSSQLVIDLTKKTAYLYLIPAKVKWQGIVVDLPKGYKPKLTLEVFRYNRKGEPKVASTHIASRKTLYRATTDPEARNGAHFTEKEKDAFAYTKNPGFGGPRVFQYDIDVGKHLDAEHARDGLEDLADAYLDNLSKDELEDLEVKIPRESYDYYDEDEEPPRPPPLEARDVVEKWRDWGYSHVFHVLENARDVEEVVSRKYDWISYEDDFPLGSITWKNLSRATIKPSRELTASAAKIAARYQGISAQTPSSDRVASRWRRGSVNFTAPYLQKLIETAVVNPEWGEGSPAARLLRRLSKSVEMGNLDPFPVDELWEYLESRGADAEEIALLQKVRLPSPPKKKVGPTIYEALMAFDRVAGKPITLINIDLDRDHQFAPALMAISKALAKLPRRSAKLWASEVKRVRLQAKGTRGEDASWNVGGVIALTLGKTYSVPSWMSHIVHELGHALEEKIGLVVTPWDETPYGQPPYVSAYADKNATEDFAETFLALELDPGHLKQVAPAKYDDMRSRVR